MGLGAPVLRTCCQVTAADLIPHVVLCAFQLCIKVTGNLKDFCRLTNL
jgi:hypothetical protein